MPTIIYTQLVNTDKQASIGYIEFKLSLNLNWVLFKQFIRLISYAAKEQTHNTIFLNKNIKCQR